MDSTLSDLSNHPGTTLGEIRAAAHRGIRGVCFGCPQWRLGLLVAWLAMPGLALAGFLQEEINNTPAGGTVTLPAGVFWENVQICKDLTLEGAGAQSTIIDGNATGSVFRICNGSTVTLDGLTICNGLGAEGGGIWNAGTLTLRSVVVTNNSRAASSSYRGGAAGLFNSGTAYLEDCIVRGNDGGEHLSGGIYNSGTIRVERTLISGNDGESSGGINNTGSMFLKDTTIASNVGHGIGGIVNAGQMGLENCAVVDNYADGVGGIHNGGVMALTNCTVSGNDGAETGGIYSGGAGSKLTLESCTVCNNRGSIPGFAAGITHGEGVAELRNTIVASNDPNLSGSFVSLGHNLIRSNQTGWATAVVTITGDTNSNLMGVDPLLGPLQDNGGPTWTHALRPGSPAIDAGATTSVPATDQRGYQRVQDGNRDGLASSDIGSFELQWPVVRVTKRADNGPGSLRQAIATASAGDTIEIAVAGTIRLTSGELWITRDLFLNGLGTNRSIITGAGLAISNDVRAWISNLALTGIDGPGSGKAIYNQGNLTVDHCVISNNSSERGDGGGIYNQRNLTLTDCSILGNNTTEGSGGGIANSGSLTMSKCTVAQNLCIWGSGGGIMNYGTLDLTNCTISQNRVEDGDGGGIRSDGFAILFSSTICSNRGSGLMIGGGKVISRNTIYAGNATGTNAMDCSGILESAGFNLLESQNGCTLVGETNGNILGQNPLLGPLQDNGGPTWTHALRPGSPAIDAGANTSVPATDQRGYQRVRDGSLDGLASSDIGSFELQWPVVRVTSLSDNGPGSLRQAIATASAGDTIEIAVVGTNRLTSGKLWITRDLFLNGLGADRSFITGAGLVVSNDVRTWISNLAITGVRIPAGGSGNAIYNRGNLTMDHCVISNNGSELGDGGGIYNQKNLTMTGCSITSNYTPEGSGGGIYSSGFSSPASLTMNNCTVAKNFCARGGGGGISSHGTLVLTNCTISQNRVYEGGCGGISSDGFAIITSSTICSNRGSGLGISGKVISRNTIYAGNATGTNAMDCSGILESAGFNLLESQNGCTLVGETNGNILGQNPLLGPLQDNGGPTWTHALRPGSPAIDAGSPSSDLTTDQRGVKRPQDGDGDWIARLDIGAFECADARQHHIVGMSILPNGRLQLQMVGVAGRLYGIEATTNLVSPTWAKYDEDTGMRAGTNGVYTFTDWYWSAYPSRFYRTVER